MFQTKPVKSGLAKFTTRKARHSPVDKNPIENAIRPILISQKNLLFTDSKRAGQHAATIQIFIRCCPTQRLDPV